MASCDRTASSPASLSAPQTPPALSSKDITKMDPKKPAPTQKTLEQAFARISSPTSSLPSTTATESPRSAFPMVSKKERLMSSSSTASASSSQLAPKSSLQPPTSSGGAGSGAGSSAAAPPPKKAEKLPARPADVFEVFIREKKDEIRKDYAGFNKQEIHKTYKRKWDALTPDKQKPYLDKFKKEVDAYEKKAKALEAEQEKKLSKKPKAPASTSATAASSAAAKRQHDGDKTNSASETASSVPKAKAPSHAAGAPEVKKPKMADPALPNGAAPDALQEELQKKGRPEVMDVDSTPSDSEDDFVQEIPRKKAGEGDGEGESEGRAEGSDAQDVKEKSKAKKANITSFFKPGASAPDFSKPADDVPGKRKFLSKAEKENKKQEEIEQRKRKRQEEKEERDRLREKAKEDERERKRLDDEAKKPKDDIELLDESAPLPTAAARVRYPLPLTHYADMIATAEFARRFSSVMATDKLQSLTFHRLQDAIFDPTKSDKIAEVLAYMLITLLEVDSGDASCHVPTEYSLNLCDLPLSSDTASEMCRLYLKQTKFENQEILAALETRHFAALGPQAVVEVLAYLRDQHFHSHHVAERIDSAHTRIAEIQKELYHLRREVKRKEKEKATSKPDEDTIAADARLAAELAQRDKRTRSARAPSPKEDVEDVDTVKIEDLEGELQELEPVLGESMLGQDRAFSTYRIFDSIGGLFCETLDGEWLMYTKISEVEELSAALNERGLRERALKDALMSQRPAIKEHLKMYNPMDDPEFEAVRKSTHDPAGIEKQGIDTLRVELSDFYKKIYNGGFGCPQEADVERKIEFAEKAQDLASVLLRVADQLDLRYTKAPLGWKDDKSAKKDEETPAMDAWRTCTENASTVAKLYISYGLLHDSIRWERSAENIKCKVCRKNTDGPFMLLCDGCDTGFHMYCLKPKLAEIPEGNWFCNSCRPPEPRRARVAAEQATTQMMLRENASEEEEEEEEEEENEYEREGEEGEGVTKSTFKSSSRGKKEEMEKCAQVLSFMRKHQEAWPFLEAVDKDDVPDYYEVISDPMDFATIHQKLESAQYRDSVAFADDMRLIFKNCKKYNIDDSEAGKAGMVLSEYFEDLWASTFCKQRSRSSGRKR